MLFLQIKTIILPFYVYFVWLTVHFRIVFFGYGRYNKNWQYHFLNYEGGVSMEIGSLADIALAQMPALSTAKPSDISIAMLSKQLDMTQEMGADMIKAMEHSVQPNIGGNIDVYA